MKYKEFLTMKEITEGFGVSRRTIYNWMETEGFPKPVRISKRKIYFSSVDIENFISKRKGD